MQQPHPTKQEIFEKKSWIGGPTHYFQKQHIPGYQGHVPSLNSESLFSKNFAKLTSDCLEERVNQGFIISEKERFKTVSKQEFKSPDLRQDDGNFNLQKTLKEFNEKKKLQEKIIQETMKNIPQSIEDIPPIDRVPVIGYMGYQPVYRYPLKQIKKVEIPEDKMKDVKFKNASEGFQNLLLNEDLAEKLKDKEVPIVGYTGFVSGIKAENKYGKSYRDITEECFAEKKTFA